MHTKIKTNTELETENDHLLRKLTEFKASNQDKLHSTMIKNILSVGAWNHYQGSQQVKGKESRKTLAACHRTLYLTILGQHFLQPLGMDSEAGSVRLR